MNRLGMLIDLSHVSEVTMEEVLDYSKAPVIFSHTSAFSICAHYRNAPDFILEKVVSVNESGVPPPRGGGGGSLPLGVIPDAHISGRDEFRSGGGGGAEVSCPNIFFIVLREKQVVLPEYYLISPWKWLFGRGEMGGGGG